MAQRKSAPVKKSTKPRAPRKPKAVVQPAVTPETPKQGAFSGTDYASIVFKAIGVIILAVVTIFAFFAPQTCNGIDNQYLYCRTHPFGFFDAVGFALFYGGAAWILGFVPDSWYYLGKPSESKNILIGLGSLLVGIGLVWLF